MEDQNKLYKTSGENPTITAAPAADNDSSKETLKKFNKSVSYTPQSALQKNVDRSLVYQKIKELAPVNITALARELPYSRTSVYYSVRALEMAQLVETRVILKDNHSERLVCIPDYKRARLEDQE